VQYYLAEWGQANICFPTANHSLLVAFRPSNKEELFNLQHTCARNVIERIFGILKRRFMIFSHPPEYNMKLQVRFPPALGAVHNFICIHDPEEINNFADISDEGTHERYGTLALGPAGHAARLQVAQKHNEIAERIWVQYQAAFVLDCIFNSRYQYYRTSMFMQI
jgi:hypothetical protein